MATTNIFIIFIREALLSRYFCRGLPRTSEEPLRWAGKNAEESEDPDAEEELTVATVLPNFTSDSSTVHPPSRSSYAAITI